MKKNLSIVALVLAIVFYIALTSFSIYNYNNGICRECGHKYTTSSYMYHGNTYTDFTCENCHNGGTIKNIFKTP